MKTQRTQVLQDQLVASLSQQGATVLDIYISLRSAYESSIHIKIAGPLSTNTINIAFPIDRYSEPLDSKLLVQTALIKYSREDWSSAKYGGEFRQPFIDDSPDTSRKLPDWVNI